MNEYTFPIITERWKTREQNKGTKDSAFPTSLQPGLKIDAVRGGAGLISPALDPALPAIGLQAMLSGQESAQMVPVSPREKGGLGQRPGAQDTVWVHSNPEPGTGLRGFCKVERQGGGLEGLGRAFGRTAALCKVRDRKWGRDLSIWAEKDGATLRWASWGRYLSSQGLRLLICELTIITTTVMMMPADTDPRLTRPQPCFSTARA